MIIIYWSCCNVTPAYVYEIFPYAFTEYGIRTVYMADTNGYLIPFATPPQPFHRQGLRFQEPMRKWGNRRKRGEKL